MSDRIIACVGSSGNPIAVEAAREAAMKSVKGVPNPKVAIVFSTINYEKEFKQMLLEIRKIIKAPLIGCTGAAILTPESIYARGIGILTIGGELDVGFGVGLNSRVNPVAAGKKAVKAAITSVGNSKYENKYGLILPSGMKFPDIPGMKAMMQLGISKAMFPVLSNFMAMQGTGPAKYEEILQGVVEGSNGKITTFGGGAFDDFKGRRNYQFLNDEVYQDSVVYLLISTNVKNKLAYKHGLKPTGKSFKITKAKGSLAFEINGKPAWEGFKEVYGIVPELEKEWKNNPVLMTVGEVPAEIDDKGNYWIIAPLCIIGDAILFAKDVEEKELYICRGKGDEILAAANDIALEAVKNIDPSFTLIFSPVPRVMAMMEKIDVERQYIKKALGDSVFLGIYCCAGELFLSKDSTLKCLNETICLSMFGK